MLATVVALFVFTSIAWTGTLQTYAHVVSVSDISFVEAIRLGIKMLASALKALPLLSLAYAIATAILLGMNVALLAFYFRMYRSVPTSAASGVLGGTVALLGFGCAACGSVFIVSLITALGGTGLIATLPHHGNEIGYAGVVLLAVSAFLLVRAVNKPRVCPI
jgi:hypothetical protein